jgi:hypothetical protein
MPKAITERAAKAAKAVCQRRAWLVTHHKSTVSFWHWEAAEIIEREAGIRELMEENKALHDFTVDVAVWLMSPDLSKPTLEEFRRRASALVNKRKGGAA